MRYPYECPKCETEFDVIKSHRDIDAIEVCPQCECLCDKTSRRIAPGYFMGEKVEDASYDPAFGMIIKNSTHRKKIAKERGLIEVGTESPEKIDKYFEEKQRERSKERWRDLDNANRIEITSRG